MVLDFLSLMLSFFQAMSNSLFVLPLGFITLTICIFLFEKMGGQ